MSHCTCLPDEERERLRLLRGEWVVPRPVSAKCRAKQKADDAKWRAERIAEQKADDARWRARGRLVLPPPPELTFRQKWELKREEQHKRERARQMLAGRRFRGVVYLNPVFEGCDRHHRDEGHVQCIPKELHESIRHNLATGYNMDKINALADEWLAQQASA